MHLFSVDAKLQYFLKEFKFFFVHENIKTALKISILMTVCIFSLFSPDCPKQSRIENSYEKCGSRYLCLLLCEFLEPICWLNSESTVQYSVALRYC